MGAHTLDGREKNTCNPSKTDAGIGLTRTMNPNESIAFPSTSGGAAMEEFRRQLECETRAIPLVVRDGGEGRYHPPNCSDAEMEELAGIASRPPPGLQLYKYGSRSVVGSYGLQSGSRVCLKYYFPRRFYKHLTYGIGGSRCFASWIAALAFGRAGIPTAAPLAMIDWKKMGGLWLEQAFLATRQAEGVSLSVFAETHRSDPGRLEKVAAALRRSFSIMAQHRIIHGDLKATNILVDEHDQITFVDLDAAAFLDSAARWKELRAKDERIFADNWRQQPVAAAAFRAVFEVRE